MFLSYIDSIIIASDNKKLKEKILELQVKFSDERVELEADIFWSLLNQKSPPSASPLRTIEIAQDLGNLVVKLKERGNDRAFRERLILIANEIWDEVSHDNFFRQVFRNLEALSFSLSPDLIFNPKIIPADEIRGVNNIKSSTARLFMGAPHISNKPPQSSVNNNIPNTFSFTDHNFNKAPTPKKPAQHSQLTQEGLDKIQAEMRSSIRPPHRSTG